MSLNSEDHKRLLHFYQSALEEFGADNAARAVRWSRAEDQQTRFRALAQVGDLEGRSVLDVGCGMGEMYRYFLRNEIEVDYHGIDLVPEFIEQAKTRFPEADFVTADIFNINQHYDYVLASGALSFKVQDNAEYYRDMIKKMYELADVAVGFNMLDQAVHIDNEIYAAYDPQQIADFCSNFANHVEILVDYLPQDFAVFLYR